jgi:hypothetical protein
VPVVALDGMSTATDGRESHAKGSVRACRLGVQGRAGTHGRDTQGVADMKFRIYQYALTVMLATYTLVHTMGAKWG